MKKEIRTLLSERTDRKLSHQVALLNLPHLHADQPLNLTLERMSATQLDVLPVISRANIPELEGTLTFHLQLGPSGVRNSSLFSDEAIDG